MIPRKILPRIRDLSRKIPVVTVLGPRQAGKTTLAKACFPDYAYANLEAHETRAFASEDPVGFLKQFDAGVIIDEVQRVPSLLSEIQVLVDENKPRGKFILTGSQNILLMESISQSLAGRTSICRLLPLSLEELSSAGILPADPFDAVWRGAYPRFFDGPLEPGEWLPSYIETYVERDVRSLRNVHDLSRFQTFLRLCAGRIGQILNYASLGNDIGLDEKTVKAWISILETTFVAFRLMPHHMNLGKRLTKSPKLYFFDTGLACNLLGIRTARDLTTHHLRGGLFENFVIGEFLKRAYARETERHFYFWRDSNGNEIDCLTEVGDSIHTVEIKSSATIRSSLLSGLRYYATIARESVASQTLVYAGESKQKRGDIQILPWNATGVGAFPWE